MMLEIVTGGELFDLLADRAPNGVLDYPDAAFYTACVVAAFNHFWEKDVCIVYYCFLFFIFHK